MTKEHQTLLDDADSKVQLACAALDEYRNRSEASVLTPYRQLKREHYLFGQIALTVGVIRCESKSKRLRRLSGIT